MGSHNDCNELTLQKQPMYRNNGINLKLEEIWRLPQSKGFQIAKTPPFGGVLLLMSFYAQSFEFQVETIRFELTTSWVRSTRSPN
jgi:hypothetical protein